MQINPNKIRFIKLGQGGAWESSCIENNTVRLGYDSPHHEDSLKGNWEVVRDYWLQFRNGNRGAATRDIKQIRDFYELSEDDVWVTFYQRKLYWCRTSTDVIELEDGSRIRNVIGKWSYCDINGNPLTIDNLDGRVTKVQGYRGTICSIEMQNYLIRRINGLAIPEVIETQANLDTLVKNVEELIKGLWWNDFELLIDLLFSKSGWHRYSVLGKTEKDIDLDIYSPTTQKRGFAQVKSATNLSEAKHYINLFKSYPQFNEMFFIFHTSQDDLTVLGADYDNVHIWDCARIASLVVSSGLVSWLIEKRT